MAVFSFAPFLTYFDSLNYRYLGSADFLSPIDLSGLLYGSSFVYNPLFNHGVGTVSQIASLFPGNLLYYILGGLGFTPLVITLLYLSLIIFILQINFYIFFRYVISKKTSD